MNKKIDYKLLNLSLLILIVYLVVQTSSLWSSIIYKLLDIIIPFLIAFTIAYALYPLSTYLQSKGIKKSFSLIIILLIILTILSLIIFSIFPLLFGQLDSLFNNIMVFFKEISTNYDIDFGGLQQSLNEVFNEIVLSLGKYISDGAVSIISISFSYISNIIIIIATSIYLLIDMDKIREEIKGYLNRKSARTFKYVKQLDKTMKNYLIGYLKIALISFVEYSIAFSIIGHPNALLLGVLIAILELIPYFGGLITNTIALITSFAVGPKLFIKTLIVFLILSVIDSYVINPLVYGKRNQIHPLVVILSIFTGGILFGFTGIIIALPLSLLLITTYKFYRVDIEETIEDRFKKK